MAIRYGKDYRDGKCHAFEEHYVGAVLSEYEHNGYHDSDFYAIVWDAETETVKHVEWGTTRFPMFNSCAVDATDEVREKAGRYMAESDAKSLVRRSVRESHDVTVKGRKVSVIGTGKNKVNPRKWKGEVIPAGSVGTVFWVGEDRYRTPRYAHKYGHPVAYRLGVELEDGRKVFGPDDAFEVDQPEQHALTIDQAREQVGPLVTHFRRF